MSKGKWNKGGKVYKRRVSAVDSAAPISGYDELQHELRILEPWSKGIRFVDAEKIEAPLVMKFDREMVDSFCGNSSDMTIRSQFAE